MPNTRILLVDDDEIVRVMLSEVLAAQGFDVTAAGNVPEALKYISSEVYDVLLSDLHMPGAGDGLTVISAMRHANPRAITMLLSGFPEMEAAAKAILLQADEILVKPMDMTELVEVIKQRLAKGPLVPHVIETVAEIIGRTAQSTIDDWFARVELEPDLMAIPMSIERRCGHLPQLFHDLVDRLNSFGPIGVKEPISSSASAHGRNRRENGYSAAMLVEESRMLQVSIFKTLQDNLANIDFSVLLMGVMTIADEVDSQLGQAMSCYIQESRVDALPV